MSKEISSTIILDLNRKAQEAKARGEKVINATIGMFYNDEGAFPIPDSLKQILASHNKDEDLSYGTVDGGKEFKINTLKWFMGESFAKRLGDTVACFATPGASGALALILQNYRRSDAGILIPKLCWPSYVTMANSFEMDCLPYENFKGDVLNIESIELNAKRILAKHEFAVAIINDPCQNPTGYNMSKNDYEKLLLLVNKFEGKLIPVFDIAYIDYSTLPSKQFLEDFIDHVYPEIPVFIAASYSKSLSFYGLRLGALIVSLRKKENLDILASFSEQGARAMWSLPNQAAINVLNEAFEDVGIYNELRSINEYKKTAMAARGKIFMDDAKASGLKTYPYSAGFFVSIPVKDALKTTDNLIKEGIYVSPIRKDIVRIALCAINEDETKGLAEAIKRNI